MQIKILPRLSFTVTPVGSLCNFRCDYCYTTGGKSIKSSLPPAKLEELFRYTIQYAKYTFPNDELVNVHFLWHGGEPLLAGKRFYQNVVDVQQQLSTPSILFSNAIQTNGSLIDKEFANFFALHKFQVAVSFDGLPEIHDTHRKDTSGRPTSAIVLRSMDILKKAGIIPGCISVIVEESIGKEKELYEYLKSTGLHNVDFSPCTDINAHSYSLHPEKYASFMLRLFKLWVEDPEIEGRALHIRFFENTIATFAGLPARLCTLNYKHCGSFPKIGPNGDIYYCENYGSDFDKDLGFYLGSIYSDNLNEVLKRKEELKEHLYQYRRGCYDEKCEWADACANGCPRYWYDGKNYFCSAYKKIFPVIKSYVDSFKAGVDVNPRSDTGKASNGN